MNGRRFSYGTEGEGVILLGMEDISEQRRLQERNDSFISMASHELKTPVTTIKTLTQILQERYRQSEDTILVEYLVRLSQQIDQLTKLVTDLLDVSRIKANKFEIEEQVFDFDTLVDETVKNCQFLSPRHHMVITGKTLAAIKGDRYSISRVIINLLMNAIKYSPNAGEIIISLSHMQNEVCVGIQDFGIGIAETDKQKIFDRFYQVGGESGKGFAGLGIGLYISTAIVQQHKGRIWVESKEGRGSTFYFTLPSQAITDN